MQNKNLHEIAHKIRGLTLEAAFHTGAAHVGGSLSTVEILTALYYEVMQVFPQNPQDENRDRFILSKGHGALALYAILADKGFYPLKELCSIKKFSALLQGHPIKTIPGIEMSSGSLGQGISFALGKAFALNKQNLKARVFVLAGDGEMQEGQNWEALLLAAKLKLNNLTVIIDNNKLQLDNTIEDILNSDKNFQAQIREFGLETFAVDGHDVSALAELLEKPQTQGVRVIIADTVKGKGVSFMENNVKWHAAKMTKEEFDLACSELHYTPVLGGQL
ncbi:transketolase [Treponema phagedenis]|uniref:Transketolase n=2 Tax=Treponema phagedenis TaxID=162 RepID=A0A0B7GWV7_TREPH|nr:transketolase [Treponema phagedenis]QEJ99023.1 transketolase [Treponema phagedenis]QEK04533.1 transketolase [Treponema phagedenis]QEK06955.1 transketolase [Treponema phagedenis]QEK10189.1 transketolase [Treponema phagedenis]QSI00037.1 transketolase [Treponema phagedenis]